MFAKTRAFKIRQAIKDDIDILHALEALCFEEEAFNKRQIGYLLNKAKALILVADAGGTVVGSIIVLLRKNISAARFYSLNVHPSYRRQGIGGALMDAALKILEEKGFRKATLEVDINNRGAQKIYVLKGFSSDTVLKKYYKNGGDAMHFVKILNN